MRKDNVAVKVDILEKLASVEYTDTFIFGFPDRKEKAIKAAVVENAHSILPFVTYAEHHNSKKHHGWAVRMYGIKANYEIIKNNAREVFTLCSINDFEQEYKEHGIPGSYNRGHIFEKWCAEFMHGTQNTKSNEKCTNSGDIVVNGEHFQCKIWNATVTTENTVNNFLAKRSA